MLLFVGRRPKPTAEEVQNFLPMYAASSLQLLCITGMNISLLLNRVIHRFSTAELYFTLQIKILEIISVGGRQIATLIISITQLSGP